MSTLAVLRFLHLLGVIGLAAGLVTAFVTELRVRRSADLRPIGEALRYQGTLGVGLVFPSALVVGSTGILLVLELGLGFFDIPWLTGMWLLFAFEFVEGNTLTRGHGLRVRREFAAACRAGALTSEFERCLKSRSGTFGLCLDLPLGIVMVSLGTMRPATWSHFFVATLLALAVAAALTRSLLRLEPSASGRRKTHGPVEQASS